MMGETDFAPLRRQVPHVALALIWHAGALLLQLRDFDGTIADPGQWGFFGGHLLTGEAAETAVRRELVEEIEWDPPALVPLGSLEVVDFGRVIHGFAVRLDVGYSALELHEGQELGLFTPAQLASGSGDSRKWRCQFPLTPITRIALARWAEPSWRAVQGGARA